MEYQFSIPEVYKTWNWSSNYPKGDEILRYFEHVSQTLDIRKDCVFGVVVVSAEFNQESGRWTVTTHDGRRATAKYFIVGGGFAIKRHIPDWPGIETYQGDIHHSSFWPGGLDIRGKRCAVVGTGASGVQLTQALGPLSGSVTVFQRTPNMALPLRRHAFAPEEQQHLQAVYPELFRLREDCFGGVLYTWSDKALPEDSEEDQEAFLENLWAEGGLRLWLANYKDILFNPASNRVVYDFWTRKIRPRIHDERTRDLLAPLDPPHAFGVKRPTLEVDYYEQFNQPNVHLVDISSNEISRLNETGLQLADGTQHDFDVIILATGFDTSTGGLMDMGLRNINGVRLEDEWKNSVSTYLGLSISGYPNLFFTYGPHASSAFSNGPSTIEVQGRWIAETIKLMEEKSIKSIDPTLEAQKAWKDKINALSNQSLVPTVPSTWMGGTFPGKPFEQLNYTGGLPTYKEEINGVLPELKGFNVVMNS